MWFLLKFLIRIALNALALFAASRFLDGFIFPSGIEYLFLGGFVLALLNTFLRPILKFLSFPFIILTFGLFNIVINIVILYIADILLPELIIQNLLTLLLASLIAGIANSII